MLEVIIPSLIIIIVGCLLHFFYEWSRKNKVVALFSAVNESTWEHIKIALIPTIIFCLLAPLFFTAASKGHFLVASAVCVLTVTVAIPLLFYPIQKLMKRHSIPISILEFCIAIFLSQLLYQMFLTGTSLETFCSLNDGLDSVVPCYPNYLIIISAIIFIVISIVTFVFTFFPPKFFLCEDPRNHKYGLKAFQKMKHGRHRH